MADLQFDILSRMTKKGHYLSALAVSTGILMYAAKDAGLTLVVLQAMQDVTKILSDRVADIHSGTASILLALGLLAGSNAPDYLEVVYFEQGQRYSLIAHRTLTHIFLMWVVLLLLTVMQISMNDVSGVLLIVQWWLVGFFGGGVLHILLDMGTPTGVPIFFPYRKRYSLNIYRTSALNEYVVAVVLFVSGWIVFKLF